MLMNNKIYVGTKKFIKEYKTVILVWIIGLMILYIPTGYSVYKPGGTIDIAPRISGDNLSKSSGSFNMAYVSMLKGNIVNLLLAKVIPSWELIDNDDLVLDEEDLEDSMKRDRIYYEEAVSNALYVALTKSSSNFKIKSQKEYIVYLTKENDSKLKVGDEIISYDDNLISDILGFRSYINSKKAGDKIKISYKRNKQEHVDYATIYEEDDVLYLGISTASINEYSDPYNLEYKSKSSESGPSGGLIMALTMYDAIIEDDLTHGKKIVGTGTIDKDGNVGEIGGVEYKLSSAVKDGADLFLCPKENYDDAIKYAKRKNYDIIIKDVETFDDTVSYLNSLEE